MSAAVFQSLGRKLLRPSLLTALAYAFLAISLTSPLLHNDQLAGEAEGSSLGLWAVWYPPHALHYNYDLSYTDYAVYPYPQNYLPALSLPNSLLYSLLKPIFGVTLGYNLLYPLALWAAALAMYVYLRRDDTHSTISIMGGAMFAFNPLTHAIAQQAALPLLGIVTLPLWMLAWEHFLILPSTRRALLLAGLSYLGALWSLQFWGITASLLLPYALWRGYEAWGHTRSKGAQQCAPTDESANQSSPTDSLLTGVLVLAILIFIFPASSLLWSTYELRYSPLHLWWGIKTIETAWMWAFGGLGLLGVGIISLSTTLRRGEQMGNAAPTNDTTHAIPTVWIWAGLMALNIGLYVEPSLAPLTLLGRLFSVPHNPDLTSRTLFGVAAIVSGLLAFKEGSPTQKLDFRLYGLRVMTGISIGAWIASPLTTTTIPAPTYYQTIAADPENYLIADLPLSTASINGNPTGLGDALLANRSMAMVAQHHKRIWGGVGESLAGVDYTQQPFSNALLGNLTTDPAQVIEIRRDVQRWRTGYLVFWKAIPTNQNLPALRDWLTWTNTFCLVHSEGDVEFWRAYWHPAGCPAYQMGLGTFTSQWALGTGWGAAETWDRPVRWAGPEQTSTLTLWANDLASDVYLTFNAQSTELIPEQTVEIFINGHSLGETFIEEDWSEERLRIPREFIGEEGLLQVELRHSQVRTIDGRTLTAVYDWIRISPDP